MRKLIAALGFAAVAFSAVPAQANGPCGQPPPAWWNAPRVSYIYHNDSGRSYASATAPRAYAPRAHDSQTRYRVAHPVRTAHGYGYTSWR